MNTKELFSPELICLNLEVKNKSDLFRKIADDLNKKGYVNAGYLKGISQREEEFPTGLITQHLNIALPHSDTQYIEKAFIYIVRLNEPITFNQMGDNQEIKVKDIFFLGIKDSAKQVNLLASLMDLFSNDEFVNNFVEVSNKTEMLSLVNKNL
ncbi:PTS sugar transporter subunit IIA [Alkalibacterium sp. MB6]|uniref:PTS sugar transporter subunit IIA n=1 Tax=Alkalibacterium sp. MB6 TaxID=2081965 RepID=UPI00137A729C|nr:PTS sugar transporter subunit IIA [Alkalibacterium sp. MB6]